MLALFLKAPDVKHHHRKEHGEREEYLHNSQLISASIRLRARTVIVLTAKTGHATITIRKDPRQAGLGLRV
jgi:hypothetical protein